MTAQRYQHAAEAHRLQATPGSFDSVPSNGGMSAPSRPAGAHEPHEGAARLTGEQISAINRFPDDNPNPVMRFDADGHLIYANPASAGVLQALGVDGR